MDKIIDLIANKKRKSIKSLSERIEEFNQLRGEILNAQVSKNN